jgi:hypothetical protein
VTMKPPTGGPSTGPSNDGMVSHAIAATSSWRGGTCQRL